jgi:hypothetical protein
MAVVKRLQIMIEEELDEALGLEAERQGVSKAALIRRYVGERLRPSRPRKDDPLWQLAGMIDSGDPNSSASIDEVVYGDLGSRS